MPALTPSGDPPVPPVTPVTPDPPTPPTASAPAFADLGATFNDATRAMVGGLWQNVVEEGGQGNGSVFRYGDFINVLIAFVSIAAAVFFLVV